MVIREDSRAKRSGVSTGHGTTTTTTLPTDGTCGDPVTPAGIEVPLEPLSQP